MILAEPYYEDELVSKPRASGDYPGLSDGAMRFLG